MALHKVGGGVEKHLERRHLARLDQAEMTIRHAISGERGIQPSTGIPSGAAASHSIRAWRSLPTRLKITPDTVTSARKVAKPCTVAAALCACAPASTTRITGRPSIAAVSAVDPADVSGGGLRAVEQAHDAFADDDIRTSDRLCEQGGDRFRAHRPAVDIQARPAAGRRVESGINIIRPDLEG